MCNLAEYIVARRAIHIVCCLSNPDCDEAREAGKFKSFFMSSYDSMADNKSLIDELSPEEAINIQQRLQDVFTLCLEGSTLKRFVGVNTTSENAIPEAYPIFLLEVFEPSHAWIPIYIGTRSVMMVSPFKNPMMERFGGSPYVYELFPVSLIRENRTFTDVNNSLFEPFIESDSSVKTSQYEAVDVGVNTEEGAQSQKNPSYSDIINEAVTMFACGIQNSDRSLSMGSTDIPAEKVVPVSMESIELKKIKSVYGVESIAGFESAASQDDGVIGTTDYMPIYITDGEDHGPAVYENTEKDGILKITFRPRVGGVVTGTDKIVGILTKENLKYGNIYIIELDCNCYYAGKCQVGTCDEHGETKVEPLFDYFYSEGDEVAVAESEYGIGTESAKQSVGSMAKAFATICTKFGIKAGSAGFNMMKVFLKLPLGVAKWVYKTIMSTFKTGLQLEKEETLEMQEKLLNDELDLFMERIRYFSQVHVKAVTLSIIFGGFVWFPFTWLWSRSRTKKAKIKALDRLELRIDGAIERLQAKINHAQERSENEDEDKLMKELQLYKLAKMRVIELKKDAFGGKRIKYATFDKDLSMTSSQRIDALLRGSGNPDY